MIDRCSVGASGYGAGYLCDDPNGEAVLFDDHEQLLAEANAEIKELQQQIRDLCNEIRDMEYEMRNNYDY